MAPSAIYQPVVQPPLFNKGDLLKVKNAPYSYGNNTWKKPVADDYMYAFKYNATLPTRENNPDVLDFTREDEQNVQEIAQSALQQLEQVIQSRDSKAFAHSFLDCGKLMCAA